MNMTAREVIAHVLLMGRGAYDSPEEWADGLLLRLHNEGFVVLARQPPIELPATQFARKRSTRSGGAKPTAREKAE